MIYVLALLYCWANKWRWSNARKRLYGRSVAYMIWRWYRKRPCYHGRTSMSTIERPASYYNVDVDLRGRPNRPSVYAIRRYSICFWTDNGLPWDRHGPLPDRLYTAQQKIPVYLKQLMALERFIFFRRRNISKHGMKRNLSDNLKTVNSFIFFREFFKNANKLT